MAATKASTGYLGTLAIGSSASPPVYSNMLEVKSIRPALYTVPSLDATHLQSPNATEEKLPGLIRPGTLSMTGNFVGDTTQLNISSLAQARTVFPWRFTAPVNAGTQTYTATGMGFISRYEHDGIEASRIHEFTMEIEVTGNITEAVA